MGSHDPQTGRRGHLRRERTCGVSRREAVSAVDLIPESNLRTGYRPAGLVPYPTRHGREHWPLKWAGLGERQ